MKKKSIAFVIGSLNSGGAERVVSTLSNELIKSYDVSIITFVDIPAFYKLDDRINVLPCFTKIKPSKNVFHALSTNYKLYKKISGYFKSKNIDVAIGFLTTSNVLAVLASRANNIPVVISERINPNATKKTFIWERLRKFTYPKANFVVIQTEIIKDFFSSWIESTKLVILPNPLSPDLKNQKKEAIKENIILNVGRLTDQKGQDVLINAFSNINPINWKLIIIGEGKNRPTYEKLIDTLNMKEKILLLGRKKNVSEYYTKSKIFAFPSRFEGFPNALIEAMHMGLPCISADCPTGPSELIEDAKNGFLIKVDDQKSLEVKMSKLINDETLRNTFSRLGEKTVAHFSIENVSKKWEEVILSALDNHSK